MNPLNLHNGQQLHHLSSYSWSGFSNVDQSSKITEISLTIFKILPFIALSLSTFLLFRWMNHSKKPSEVFSFTKEELSDESISFEKISTEKSFDAHSGSTSDDDENSSIESYGNKI